MKPFIDFTQLKPEAGLKDFGELCRVALEHTDVVRGVCVPENPFYIKHCKNIVGDKLIVSAVNGFPLGNCGPIIKKFSAQRAKECGADEIDTVINVGLLRLGWRGLVLDDLRAVTEVYPGAVKVILEIGHPFYTEGLVREAAKIVAESGAFCVKTSTGFLQKDISVEEKVKFVKWMHEAAPELTIKVAGGVKTMAHVRMFLEVVPENQLIIGASGKIWEMEK
jgi:deoxyribose-phosphate aldolase